jgi:uncharacterized protein with GYD domain
MMSYVALYQFTDQSAKDMRSSVKRAARAKAENK